jgi:predicted nucleic acid-binding protein
LIVLDASVLIAHLDSDDSHHKRATDLLLDLAESQLAASVVTIAEAMVGPARSGKLRQAEAAIKLLEITPVALAADQAEALARLRTTTALKLPDCCVLLAAKSTGSGVLAFDKRLANAAKKLGLSERTTW